MSDHPSLSHTALHCLSALMLYHRRPVPAERLIHDYALPEGEPSVAYLVQIARDCGFRARVLGLGWDEARRLGRALPALARLKNGRAVLLLGFAGGAAAEAEAAVVVDPLADAAAPLHVPRERFCDRWSGELVLVRPRYRLTDEAQPFGLRWFVPELLRERRAFTDVGIAAVVLHVLALATPLFFQLVIDRVLVHQSTSTLSLLAVGIVVVLLFEFGFKFLRQYLLIFATQKIDIRVMKRTFAHLVHLPIDLFERSSAGVLTKHMQQSERIREFLTGRLFSAMLDLTALFVFIPILLFYSLKLSMIVLLISGIIALIIFAMLGPFRRRLQDLYTAEGERQALLVETIHGMRTVKSLALEPRQRVEWERRAAAAVRTGFHVTTLSAFAQAVTELLEKLMTVAVVVVGAFDVFDGAMTVGALVAFQMISGRVSGPLVQIVSLVHQYQETALSVRMLGTIMNHPPERDNPHGLAPPLAGHVSLDGVTFHYPGSVLPALDRLSLTIREGSIFGVVGRSGSGKTTLTRLLQGLYPVQSGIIRIDGIDIRELDLAHLRRATGVVLQESFLFRGTIRSNIAATKSDATSEEILRAAQLAGADEFIQRLPQGFDTPLDENAANLSGGQKQRLAIARALLPDPKLLILDEATSALDPESEAILQDNLRSIAAGRTLIIVSHRLSTLVQADNILVLDQGKRVGLGRHSALVETCEVYRTLWQQQTRYLGWTPRALPRSLPRVTGPGPDGGSGDRRMPRQAMGFQPEAFAIELRPLPAAARSTLYLLLLLIVTALAGAVTALAGAYLAEVDRIVVGRGRLVTQSPTIVVQPLETSIIRSIEVDVGQLVTRGQRLATMNPTMVEADLQTVRLRLASYDAEVARLRAELNGTPVEQALPGNAPAAVLQREVYRQRQGRYQAELAAADEVVRRLEASRRTKAATVNWLQERIAALREIVEMRRTLMEGNVGSRLQWLTAQNDLIEAAGTLERTNNELHEVDHELAEKQARRESFIGQWRGEAIEAEVTARRERDRLAEDLHRQELRSRMVELTAPFDAVVLEVANRSVGSVLREAEVLFRLVPVDVPLRVDIEIDASDIAHVRAGDTVRCKFEALPFQRHGTVPGRITAITEDTLQREERQANRIVYVAHAEFDGHPALRDVPADFRLIPGMTAVVEIKTGTRRVLDYFLYPLLRGLDEGLREP